LNEFQKAMIKKSQNVSEENSKVYLETFGAMPRKTSFSKENLKDESFDDINQKLDELEDELNKTCTYRNISAMK